MSLGAFVSGIPAISGCLRQRIEMQERSGLSYTDSGQGHEENGPAISLAPQQRHLVSMHCWQDAKVLQADQKYCKSMKLNLWQSLFVN